MEKFSIGCANDMLGKMVEVFQNGVLALYSGNQPVSPEAAETGQLLCLITNNGGLFIPGEPGNGLNFTAPVNGEIDKSPSERWIGNMIVDGQRDIKWFRFYANDYITGESTTARRFDGLVSTDATSSNELIVDYATLFSNDAFEVQSFKIRFA